MEKGKNMIKWVNANTGLISIISPIIIVLLIMLGSKYFVATDRYNEDRKAIVEYQAKNDAWHQKLNDTLNEISKTLTAMAIQSDTLKDHEGRIRIIEAKVK